MMSSLLPLFPLNLVVFPQEKLNLHIFEPRYKQLINDSLHNNTTFGIPAFIDNTIHSIGTEVRIVEVVNRYDDGRMDICTEGLRIFEIQQLYNPMEGKLYAGADIRFLETKEDSILTERILLVELVSRLFDLLDVKQHVPIEATFITYLVGHYVGLTVKQEYYLLSTLSERERINFLLDHLNKVIPIVQEAEKTKQRIRMNGHFKHLNPLTF